jgi:hypothetical protein
VPRARHKPVDIGPLPGQRRLFEPGWVEKPGKTCHKAPMPAPKHEAERRETLDPGVLLTNAIGLLNLWLASSRMQNAGGVTSTIYCVICVDGTRRMREACACNPTRAFLSALPAALVPGTRTAEADADTAPPPSTPTTGEA